MSPRGSAAEAAGLPAESDLVLAPPASLNLGYRAFRVRPARLHAPPRPDVG